MKSEKKAKRGLPLKTRIILAGVLVFCVGYFTVMNLETEITVKMNNTETVITGKRFESVSSALRRNYYPRSPEYGYNVNLINFLTNVSEVTIIRKNIGEIKVDNEIIKYASAKGTVGEVLEEAGIKLGENDRVEPISETPVTDEIKEINVYRVTFKELEDQQKEMPVPVNVNENSDMGFGTFTLIQEGQKGKNIIKERIRYENDVEVGREQISEEVLEPVVEGVIEVGPMTTLRLPEGMVLGTVVGNANIEQSATGTIESELNKGGFAGNMTVSATAYTATGNSTASGTWPQSGRTLAAGEGLPFGTQVYIPQLEGIYVVEDRGGAVSNGVIDIYMDSQSECVDWGRQDIEIFLMP